MPKTFDLPPLWTLACAVCSYLLARFLPLWRMDIFWLQWSGLILIALSLGLIGWSAMWFARKKTSIEPGHKPTSLIVEGPYRVSRNPIYLAMVAFSLGLALWLGALTGFLPPVALALILHTRFVMPEEQGLREVFGAQAETYFGKSRRWL